MQFAAPVAADRGEGQARGQFGLEPRPPQAGQQAVDERGARAHQRFHGFTGMEALLQFLLAALKQFAAGRA